MKKLKAIATVILWLIASLPAITLAQSGLTEYGLGGIPQASAQNPAFRPHASLVIGLPGISSVSAGAYNTSFSFDDIFVEKPTDDSLHLDLTRPIGSKADINYFSENIAVDLLMLGFKIDRTFLSMGIRNRLTSRVYYTTDLLKFVWQGNADYINQQFNLTGSGVYQEHLNNYYLGLSFPVAYGVDMGVRVNFLQGLSNIATQTPQLALLTRTSQQTGYELIAKTDFQVHTSGFSQFLSDSVNFSPVDYFLAFNNIGFSLDVGINARIGDQFTVQASVTDFGKIYWYGNPETYNSGADEVNFSGVEYDFTTDNENSPAQVYLDSLSNLLHIKESKNIYTTALRTKVFVNGQYNTLNKKNRFNLLFAGRFLEESFEYALSVGYTFAPSEKFAVKLNYSYLKYAPLNLGLGFYFTFKPFQIYFVTDNVAAFIYPTAQKYAGVHVGINILIPSTYKNDIPTQKQIGNTIISEPESTGTKD